MFISYFNQLYKFGNRHFWAEGYYVSTVGLNEATIKKYIQEWINYPVDDFFTSIKIWERVEQDIALDKLSVKEYKDPFRDSGK